MGDLAFPEYPFAYQVDDDFRVIPNPLIRTNTEQNP
jgi:hypothetical protein